jgi:hypothetical protein
LVQIIESYTSCPNLRANFFSKKKFALILTKRAILSKTHLAPLRQMHTREVERERERGRYKRRVRESE